MTQTITQLLLFIISGIAVFTVIIPTVNSMGETQKETDEYVVAIESAYATNQRLNALLQQIESISPQERFQLDRLVPSTIDAVRTAFDLEVLVQKNNLFLITLNVMEEFAIPDPVVTNYQVGEGNKDASGSLLGNIAYRDFEIVAAGTYDQFKNLLADIESSAQLFEVQTVSFQATNSDIIQYSLVIRTFGLVPSDNNVLE